MKIGIPRALLYYHFYPFWRTLFQELGHEVVPSIKTNKWIVNKGVEACVDEACLPIKLFHGHVIDLAGKVDAILIPRFISLRQGEFICPKFIGLPEMVKNSVSNLPSLLVLDINLHKSEKNKYQGYDELLKEMGCDAPSIKRALKAAGSCQSRYEDSLLKGSSPLALLDGNGAKTNQSRGTIGLIGHPYLLYDEYASMNIIQKLALYGYRVLVPENISAQEIENQCKFLPKKLFWTYGKKLLGSGLSMIHTKAVDGMIFLTSFACGIDSFIGELLQRLNQRKGKIPYLTISLDEHSGQAGFDTRLEAFLDMLKGRDGDEGDLSPYGIGLCGSQSLV